VRVPPRYRESGVPHSRGDTQAQVEFGTPSGWRAASQMRALALTGTEYPRT